MSRHLGLGDQAKQIARGLYPKTYESTSSPAALDSARSQLAQLILHAMGKDSTAAQQTTGETGFGSGAVPPIGSAGKAFPTRGCSGPRPPDARRPLPPFRLPP